MRSENEAKGVHHQQGRIGSSQGLPLSIIVDERSNAETLHTLQQHG
jgi:hypothetical protein